MDMKLKNQTLGKPTTPISFKFPVGPKILADRLYKFMKENKGMGLAANQVGLRESVFVMEVDGKRYNVFNPTIVELSDETDTMEEGCLSFPDRTATVERYTKIAVQYHDENGLLVDQTLDGMAARCFQHEYDHLRGITMFNRQAMQSRDKKLQKEESA